MSGHWDDKAVTALRVAVRTGDGSVVTVLQGRPMDEVLQQAGDAILEAVAKGVVGAADLAEQCAAALRERFWAGDEELADQLEAATGKRAAPMLEAIPVDPEELAGLLEGDPTYGGGRIDLKTGMCISEGLADYDDEDEDEHDPDRYLYVHREGSRESYRDMEHFITTVADPGIADRLEIAIAGRGAFRRFKDVLSRWPEELERYYLFRNERQYGRAREWLAAGGYRPGPPSGWCL